MRRMSRLDATSSIPFFLPSFLPFSSARIVETAVNLFAESRSTLYIRYVNATRTYVLIALRVLRVTYTETSLIPALVT